VFASADMLERWPQVCRVKITFRFLPNDWFVFTKTNSIKCFLDWIPLNTHVRFNETQPCRLSKCDWLWPLKIAFWCASAAESMNAADLAAQVVAGARVAQELEKRQKEFKVLEVGSSMDMNEGTKVLRSSQGKLQDLLNKGWQIESQFPTSFVISHKVEQAVTPVPTAQGTLGLIPGRHGSDNGVKIVDVRTTFMIPTTTFILSRWRLNANLGASLRRWIGRVDAACWRVDRVKTRMYCTNAKTLPYWAFRMWYNYL